MSFLSPCLPQDTRAPGILLSPGARVVFGGNPKKFWENRLQRAKTRVYMGKGEDPWEKAERSETP